VGAGLAFFLGGWIGQRLGWRWAFYLLSFPGLVIALLVVLLKEVPRGQTEAHAAKYTSRDWKLLFRSVPLRYHNLGYALFGLAANNLSIWGAVFFTRVHKFDIATIGFVGGILSLIAGVPGTILGGWAADRFRRFGGGGRMRFSSAAALIAIPFWLLLIFSGSIPLLILANFVLLGLSLMWLGPAAADVHDIAGPHLRGLGIGIYFFSVNIAAYAVGSNIIGKLNDWLGAAQSPLQMRYSLLICPLACACAAFLLWRGGSRLENDQRT
jgi:predicted MFS family arabinose efflux permease